MRRNIRIFSSIVVLSIIVSLFNFPAYVSMAVNHTYYNTIGQEFIRNLNSHKIEINKVKKLPYNLNFIYTNTKIDLESNILYKNNRIYIPLKEFMQRIHSKVIIEDDVIIINDNVIVDINEKNFYKNNNKVPLRGDLFIENGEYYISFFDICEILDLTTFWNYDNEIIYIDNKRNNDVEITKENKAEKKAYIRFEDFTAGDVYFSLGVLEKVRLASDFMKKNNEKFSVSWIPRYINNDRNIDNDISKKETMRNANFIFTLDYIINRGASIGLHGYTHQHKDSNSVTGFEFGNDGYSNPEEIRKRVESALLIAKELNIPISYWETPHYRTTAEQQKIFEEYFKIIYEPAIGIYNSKIMVSKNNEYTKYIPTPLSYVEDDNGDEMLKRIIQNDESKEFSLFYHLSIEIKSIDIWVTKEGKIVYNYKDDSVLKRIVNITNKLGYRFSNINEI